MHDLDRTSLPGRHHDDSNPRREADESFEPERWEPAAGSPFSAAEEHELAAELLELEDEDELDAFLGGLIRKASKGVRRFAHSKLGRSLGGALKTVAGTALPLVGSLAGNLVAPGVGGVVGGKLGSLAGNLLELELEGLDPEAQELEAARRFVRLAGDATQLALQNAETRSPRRAAARAVASAARQQLGQIRGGSRGVHAAERSLRLPRSGRWVRRGRTITLEF